VIETRICHHCGRTQPASAAFCAACGQEFRAPRFAEEAPPPVPSWERRAGLQGKPAVRVTVAMLAASVVAVPFMFGDLDPTDWLILDALMVGVVSVCVVLERGALTPSLRASGGVWLLLAVPAGYALQWLGALWTLALERWSGIDSSGSEFVELPTWILFLTIVLVPAIFEELAFRGIFLRSARTFLRPLPAHLLTAAAFAAIHFRPLMLPFHFGIGLALGALRERSGSLWPPMLLHAVNNALAVGLLPGAPG
jgi:membrane protease YdiL (CAAX protease family)